MKRVLAMLLTVLLLTGCAGKEPAAPEQTARPDPAPVEQAESKPAPEQAKPAVPEKEPEAAPETKPETKAETTPEPEVQPEAQPQPQPEPDWSAFAGEVYDTITSQETFHILVWEEDGSHTDMVLQQGVNAWNVDSSKYGFERTQWSKAASEDWIAMTQTPGYGPQMTFYLPGEVSFSCCRGGDIVEIVDQTKVTYLRAENPNLGRHDYDENLYGMLKMVAEGAVSYQIGTVTVDGSLSPEEAARAIAEKRAENHLSAPNWIEWKASEARGGETEVYDIYRGEPEEFCCNMYMEVRFADAERVNDIHWQAGAGLEGPDEEGWYTSFSQVHVRKNEDGDWAVVGSGTGGYYVAPQWPAEKPWRDWLVEVFCLTEGMTHEYMVPNQILSLPPDQMALLPEILDQLTEAESRDLVETMGTLMRERPDMEWYYTIEDLKLLLGDYGAFLDA